MTPTHLTVIKVGGSLFDWPEFPRRLMTFLTALTAENRDLRPLLIAGGGAAAEMIRDLDAIHGLGEERSDRLALGAMDLTALVLAALVPEAIAVDQIDRLAAIWLAGGIPVLAPRRFLDEIERTGSEKLPASWSVTSDTIAAWVASHLGAERLTLLKSAPLPVGTDLDGAARLGLVDPMLPVVGRSVPRVEYLNLREQHSRPQLLT